MAKPIGTLGTIPTLEIGGRVFTDLTTLIRLSGFTNTNDNCTLRKSNGSAGYQVTGGTTLTIKAVKQTTRSALAGARLSILLAQSDNDAGVDSATALTNPVYEIGSGTYFPYVASDTLSPYWECDSDFSIAATKYVSAVRQAAGAVNIFTVYGYEA